jgi:signal transduction histidine kinase
MSETFAHTRRWLTTWNAVVLGVILILVSIGAYVSLAQALTATVDQNLAIRGAPSPGPGHPPGQVPGHAVTEPQFHQERGGYQGGLFFVLATPQGQIVANPQGIGVTTAPAGVIAQPLPRFTTINVQGEPLRVYAHAEVAPDGDQYVVLVGQSLALQEAALRREAMVLAGVGGIGLLLSLGGAWFLAGRALVPIQQAFARQQTFIADASHELRTPIAILRVTADLLYQRRRQQAEASDSLLLDLRDELGRLERLANDLLTLARSDMGQLALATGEVDLTDIAQDVVRRTAPLATEHGLTLVSEADDTPLLIEGDPDRLQQVVLIVLDNAVKYSSEGGRITVRTSRRHGRAVLDVRDSGVGMSRDDLARVFDRFYRVDAARSSSGAGIGLAIARSLVLAHHGQIALDSKPGEGTTVTVQFPLADKQPSLRDRVGQLTARHVHREPR